ncbi:MAG: aminotransferase class V-fold PLP-dependent enzyme [Candidatus Limnocylindrales bacterium]
MDRPGPEEEARIAAARAQLPALESAIYLNTGTSGPLPLEVDRAMRQLQDYELRYGRAGPDAHEELVARMAECRAAVAAILHASPDAVALTRSTTDGLNAAIWSLGWRAGDEAVTTSIEHPGLLAPLAALRERGVRVRVAEVGDGGDDDATLAAITRAVGPRTRLVALSHVSWLTGAVLPVGAVAEVARLAGAWCLVDGAQSAGAIDVDPASVGADFYAIPAQKWLLGPEGMGALWASPRAIAEAWQPYAGWWTTDEATAHPGTGSSGTGSSGTGSSGMGGSGMGGSGTGELRPWGDARRFDTSGFHRPSVAGFGRAAGWLAMHVGLPWIYERGPRLAAAVARSLGETRGVTVLTPARRMATLVAFRIAGWPAEEASNALQRRAFVSVRTLPGRDALRASVGWFNTEAELERFVGTVAEVARHAPDDFPRRAELTILGD